MRASNSRTSSSAKTLSSESMRISCPTLLNPSAGGAPTRSDGLSSRLSSGKRASIAALRRRRASKAASLMRGASSEW